MRLVSTICVLTLRRPGLLRSERYRTIDVDSIERRARTESFLRRHRSVCSCRRMMDVSRWFVRVVMPEVSRFFGVSIRMGGFRDVLSGW
jgi:hypothetical protein